MPKKTRPLSPVDAGWYHMDGATNLAMVTGVTLTQEPVDFAHVKAVYAHRIATLDRFRQRVVEKGFPVAVPHWEDDPLFNIDDHVHHVALPEPCDKRALMDFMSDLASTPLDHKRPLWQVHVVDRVDGGSAVALRFHHCVGDGTAMMAVAQRLFDVTPDAPPDREVTASQPPKAGLFDRFVRPVRLSTQLVSDVVQGGLELLTHPSQLLDLSQLAVRSAGVAVGTLLKIPDPASPFKGKLGIAKRVAWSEPLPLAAVKEIGLLTGAKVNDVLVAAMAGALRHYIQGRTVAVDGLTLRAVVPVDLRPAGRAMELGNQFGLTFLDMPVGIAGSLARLQAIKSKMDAIKRSPEAFVFMNIIGLFGRTPKVVEDIALTIFGSKATMVFTNVAGPRQELYLAGATVDRMIFWVPHPADLGMGLAIFSYNDQVTVGVVTDAGLVPDPETIAAEFNQEFERLLTAAQSQPAAPATNASSAAGRQPQCVATTAAGAPCKNRALAGSDYCRVHQTK